MVKTKKNNLATVLHKLLTNKRDIKLKHSITATSKYDCWQLVISTIAKKEPPTSIRNRGRIDTKWPNSKVDGENKKKCFVVS